MSLIKTYSKIEIKIIDVTKSLLVIAKQPVFAMFKVFSNFMTSPDVCAPRAPDQVSAPAHLNRLVY